MRVQCSTCLELLAPGDDLTCTPCGHVFHMACVLQWFESKKNCPQCRHPARESTLRKIFLAETDGDEEDTSSLQNQLDSVQLQLRIKDNEKTKLATRNKELEEQGVKQREEIKVLEKGKGRLKEQYEGMRNQARVLQGEKFKQEEATKEAQELRTKLESYKSVEVALRGQEGALNEFLHERGAFEPRTRDLATLVIMLKQKLGEVKRERSKAESLLKESELGAGQEKRRARQLEGQVGDMQAATRGLESDLEVSRIDIQKLKGRLREAQSGGSSRTGGSAAASQGSSLLESSQEELVVMDRSESEGEEEGGSHTLPSFTTATGGSRGGRVVEGSTATWGRMVEGSTATPPLASCNILTRRPLGQIKNPGLGSLSQQYDGLGGRARDLFAHSSNKAPTMQIKSLSSSQPGPKKRKLAPFTKAPVSKQIKTVDKFFGSFDTP